MAKWNVEKISESLGINPATLWRWRKAGRFPEPIAKEGRDYIWSEEQMAPFLGNSRNRNEMALDEALSIFTSRADKAISDYQSDEPYTQSRIASLLLCDFLGARTEIAVRIGLSEKATFEDISTEIEKLKSQTDAIKNLLNK